MLEHRMPAEKRRAAIIKAALPIFARFGLANTTTKQLAEAAGVSEALLYKHFPSKDSLYAAIQSYGCKDSDPLLAKLAELPPSTSTLVHVVYLLMRSLILGNQNDPIGSEIRHRLTVRSCLEDGAFPKGLFDQHYKCCLLRLEGCLQAAIDAGDLIQCSSTLRNRIIFAHHLACMAGLIALSQSPVIDYAVDPEQLLHEAVLFALRGIGLTEKAIATHYNPKTLSLFCSLTTPPSATAS